jgi:predicted PurR-regulated permease PerM
LLGIVRRELNDRAPFSEAQTKMIQTPKEENKKTVFQHVAESSVRLLLLAVLGIWCFEIIRPFVVILIWGGIIAVASFPLYKWLLVKTNVGSTAPAIAVVALMLVVLIAPSFLIAGTLIESAEYIASELELVGFQIPPPDKDVLKWSFIGQPIYDTWFMAATNLQELVSKIEPQLRTLAGLVLKAAAGAMGTVFIFVASVLIAGFLLARYRNAQDLIKRIAIKIDPSRGQDLIEVATQTIRSVAQGVIGVALIQGLLATFGMVIIGIPGAPLWGLAVLVIAVVQLPPMLILGVVSVYVFYMMSTPVAIGFLVYSLLVSSIDMVLKPLLLGRGVNIPMLVILLGALGGLISAGMLGLFVGAVVLAVGYQVLMVWLGQPE